MAHMFSKGDLVQLSRLGVRKQYKGTLRLKTEASRGRFVRYDGGSCVDGKYTRALIEWFTDEPFPPSYQQLTRLDYIEQSGTPR